MLDRIVGVDVASKALMTYREPDDWRAIANERSDIQKFLSRLPKDSIIAIEATGGYGHLLAELAFKKGFTVFMLRASKVKDHCKSSPSRGKSDKHDARDIASYVNAFYRRLHPWTPLPPFEAKLRRLFRKKEGLTDHVASLRLMLKSLGDSQTEIRRCLDKLQGRIQKLADEIETMLAGAEDAKVLYTIPAVKDHLIAAVLPALRTIKFKDKYALDSYAGMDLKMRESGRMIGRRHISHEGDSHIRRAVYLAGFSGITCKAWKHEYERLRKEKRLSTVAAINALGRKILHTVYGVYRSQKAFVALTPRVDKKP